MSIFEVLGRQQRQIQELIEDTIQQMANGQKELAFVTFQLLANKLTACMRAEHATVYPRLERDAGLVIEVGQARAEHEAIEDAITRLRVAGLRRSAWLVELSNLARMVEQHAEHEEFTLFPIAALTFSAEQLFEIGQQFAMALAVASTVADAAITYDTAEFEPPPTRVVRVTPKAA
jgi:hemerythrin-like domain-containing protein